MNILPALFLPLLLVPCSCTTRSLTVVKEGLQLLGTTRVLPGNATRSFTVDWDNDRFLKDGEPFQFYSGGMHYFRVPEEYWEDRMNKIRLAGMNTLQTYIAWNAHQPQEHEVVGIDSVMEYLSLAGKMGLNVVLRPGPYICAEWTFGGLPYWLLNKPGIQFRVYNEPYIAAIGEWFSILLPKIEPFLYKNGGPIIAVQVENEYGAYGPNVCDHKYLQFILDQYIKYFGDDVVYYTVDNTNVVRLACGALPGLLKTLDFGPDKIPHFQFEMLRKFQPHGPLVNTEFWSGWFDKWGDVHANVSATKVAKRLDQMLQLKASVNLYMFEGGTNFGYTNGAMSKDGYKYNARVTSYDYDSPLTEAGDTTPKYWDIRQVMKTYVPLPPGPVPPHSHKWSSPVILLTRAVSLFDNIATFSQCQTGVQLPATMEQFNQSDGFILYKLQWSGDIRSISLFNVHDRAIVYLGNQRMGTVDRREVANGTIVVPGGYNSRGEEVTISILVENMGRVNHGSYMGGDYKGITKMVLVDGVNVNSKAWTVCPLPLATINQHALLSAPKLSPFSMAITNETFTPTFFCANFTADTTNDTFLDPRGWGKGVAFLNDKNLGRYWPATGPQVTLYTPGIFFTRNNLICLFEVDYVDKKQSVQFISKPILGLDKQIDSDYNTTE